MVVDVGCLNAACSIAGAAFDTGSSAAANGTRPNRLTMIIRTVERRWICMIGFAVKNRPRLVGWAGIIGMGSRRVKIDDGADDSRAELHQGPAF